MDWEFDFTVNLKVSKDELKLISRALDYYNNESPLTKTFASIVCEVERI